MADVTYQNSSAGGHLFESVSIDPMTLLPASPNLFAGFGCPSHAFTGSDFSWKLGAVFVSTYTGLGIPRGAIHVLPQGSSVCGISGAGPYLGQGSQFRTIRP
jgi:hypothetical protein